ncbi:MAG: hypothetical protein ACI4Q8_04720 [Ruminococcus sp.]
MKFASTKKFISVCLAVIMLVSTIICGAVVTDAATYNVGDIITYQFVVNTGCKVQAFEGVVYFPSEKLSVVPYVDPDSPEDEYDAIVYDNLTGSPMANATSEGVEFNASFSRNIYDFTNDNAMVTVKFSVDDADFSPTEIYTKLTNIYDKAHNAYNGNNPYSYQNVINDKVISGGTVDLDNGTSEETTSSTEATEATTESTEATVESTEATVESTEATTESTVPTEVTEPTTESTAPTEATEPALDYTVQFNYVTEDGQQTLTKTISTTETDVQTIVNTVMPNIENKMYSYTLGLCIADGTTITANLNETKKLYTVTVDGEIVGTQYGYKDKATVTLADGTEYTFYVTGDIEITSDDPKETVAISLDALTISDTRISMDLLATANVEKFARMGVAFATEEKTADDIKSAVANVTTGTAVSNGIAVHNSTVDSPNESGSYQFVYAPYVSKEKSDRIFYFYTFAVDTDGNVSVSSVVSVDLTNAYV